MTSELESILTRIPGWKDAKKRDVRKIAGLTNENYRVDIDGESYVLRLNGENAEGLGINRDHELEALEMAGKAGIAPEIVLVIPPEGHLVTQWIDGNHWTPEEYRKRESIAFVVNTVKQLHALPAIKGQFSPLERVERLIRTAKSYKIDLPEEIDGFLKTAKLVERDQNEDTADWRGFCHNDLVAVNFLFSEKECKISLLDFEFAGMGDIYFDLATLVYAHDNVGPIPRELEEYLLSCYFEGVDDFARQRLAGMKFMLLLFYALWGLAQHGMQTVGLVPKIEGFNYLEYSQYLLSHDVLECQSQYLAFKR